MKTRTLKYANQNKSKNALRKIRIGLSILLLNLVLLTSCNKDEVSDQVDPQPDGVALKQRFMDNRSNALQTFTINATMGGTITGSQGSQIRIPANAIGLNGNPVAGNITIEFIEIYEKGEMVLQDMSTKGRRTNVGEEALRTFGEYFINAKQNNTTLEILEPIRVIRKPIPVDGLGELENIKQFKAGRNINDEELWRRITGNVNADVANDHGDETIYYYADVATFGWTNLDRWYNFQGQLTSLTIEAPEGYDNTNAAIYLSYDDETGLARMDRFDSEAGLFTEHFGRIPVGQEVHFIMITEIAGQIHYAIQGATIVNNHTEVMTNLQPIAQADLMTLINNLP